MKLRVAKKIYLGRPCQGGCGHNWSSIEKSTYLVHRAYGRGSRLLNGPALRFKLESLGCRHDDKYRKDKWSLSFYSSIRRVTIASTMVKAENEVENS